MSHRSKHLPKLTVALLIVMGLAAVVVFGRAGHFLIKSESPQPTYHPVSVQQQEFNITLQGGRPTANADFEYHAKQGELVSFIVGSDQPGVMSFTPENGATILRQIVVTPGNQFYLPSDKPISYKVVFDVNADINNPDAGRTGSYYLGTLVIDP